ncbi:hypothetical protein F25303_2603 [Fusarium sp. NRRL 25303]|nr:hypothetical protein F25303_2603 [Fusarium sp. NRRL 25303]
MVATDNGRANGRELEPEEMIPMGRVRYARIEEAIHQHRQVNHSPYKQPPSLAPSYRAECSPATMLSVPMRTIETTLEDHSEPKNGYILVDVDSTTPNPREQAPYLNYVHEDGRVIMCLFNYKELDPTPKEQALKWADIMAASCVEALSPSGRLPILQGITSIWRISIDRDNRQTHKIIDMLRDIHKSTGGPFEITPAVDDLLFLDVWLQNHHLSHRVSGFGRSRVTKFSLETGTCGRKATS